MFSQRIGKTPITKPIQIESMDDDLRNCLWNVLKTSILDNLRKRSQFRNFCKKFWHNFLKLPIDKIPKNLYDAEQIIRDTFFSGEWFRVYDLIGFITKHTYTKLPVYQEKFKTQCNNIFKKEQAGYRFVGNDIVPITNPIEIEEIENAISFTLTSQKGANIHLKSALEKLSDRKNPDCRNSIKESISAIESVAKTISGNSKDSLGKALNTIKDKVGMHEALVQGLKQLYGYTSDADGIRHALMDNHNCSSDDAKFMLVLSSAFVNYLIAKANKASIIFK